MAASVDIVVKVFDQASKALKDIAKANGDLGKGSKSTAEQLKGLGKAALGVTAAVAAFGVAAKAAFEIGKQGAAIKQTGESFEFLLSKVGASADTLNQLRTASRGTISDMELMSSTATLLAGAQGALATELAKSTPQLLNIAKAAQKLNPALGSTTFLYDSLATGVKRASPMILDNLGLTIRIGAANEAFAKTLGKTVAALTADEQKQALLNETLRAGAVLIEQAGGTTESATDSYDQLTAVVTNLTNRYKAQVHEGLKPVIEATRDYVMALDEAARNSHHVERAVVAAQKEMGTAVYKTTELSARVKELSENYIATAAEVLAAGGRFGQGTGQIENTSIATKGLFLNTARLRNLERELAVALGESTAEIENKKDRVAKLTAELYNEEKASQRNIEQTDKLILKIANETQLLEQLETAFANLSATQQQAAEDNLAYAASADKAMMGFQNSIRELSYMTDETVTAAQATAHFKQMEDDVAIALGDTNQTIVDQRNKVERLRQEWEDSNFTNKEVERQLYYSTINLDRYTNSFQDNTRNVETNTGALKDNNVINEAGRVLRDAISVATGRQTEKQVALRLEQERWTALYKTSTGPAKEHAFNMALATAVALDAETRAQRTNTSATNAATTAQIAYNQALTGTGTGAGAFTGTVSGDVAGGLGLKSMEDMRKELGVAAGTDYWKGASERDVMAEYYKLTQLAAGNQPDWDAFYDEINKDRAERGEGPITVMDVSKEQKALDLKSQLESMEGGHGSIFTTDPDTGQKKIKDWMEPLFEGITDFDESMVGLQHGGSFTVPSGYRNDSFLMGVSSGERVSVTPAHSTRGGGGMVIQNLNVYGVQTDSELFESVVRAARQRGRDFARVM